MAGMGYYRVDDEDCDYWDDELFGCMWIAIIIGFIGSIGILGGAAWIIWKLIGLVF